MGNSTLAKLYSYSPLNHLGFGKALDPIGYSKFGGYSTSSGPGTPGPFAGKTPTLADANAGYQDPQAFVRAASQPPAGGSMNNLFNRPQPGVPRPVMGAQPPPVLGAKTQGAWGGMGGY